MQEYRWQQLEQIFNRAALLPAADREDFIEELCKEDEELCHEVLLLVKNDSQENSFLDEPVFSLGAEILDNDWINLLENEDFAHYRLKKLLGRGGMGTVFLAEDTRLERLVAIKVLPSFIAENSATVKRFRQEACAASGVSHPNIAHIYEFDKFNERWFLAMEYVAGKNLRERLREESFSEIKAINIARQIAEALVITHRSGIIHRDIKPENIIVTDGGLIKILDFGVAKWDIFSPAEQTEDSLNDPFKLAGTAPYMSPEQINDEKVDARTDLWSLGVVFFEMLTNRRPFQSETLAGFREAISQDEPSIETSDELRPIIARLLEKNPADRYQTAENLLADLEQFQLSARNFSQNVSSEKNNSKLGFSLLLILFAGLATVGLIKINSTVWSNSKPIHSIAVLPFINETGNENEDYLSEGLTDSLTGKLSRLPNITIKARGSVSKYKNASIEPRRIGEELAVQAVLQSRLVKQNDRLMIDLKMFDTQTGKQIWSKQYSRHRNELILLENEIARDVSDSLNAQLSAGDQRAVTKKFTENFEAYHLYLKGRYHWNKRTDKDLQKSIEYFERAIALDSNFALAYAGLADDYVLASGYAISTPHESFPKAKVAALRALEIDNSLAEAHNALAYVLFNYEWNFAEAEKEIKIAIDLNPNYATAHQWYGNAILLTTGRHEQAIAELKLARELDPLSLIINADLGTTYIFARQVDAAAEQLVKTLEMDENFAYARVYLGRCHLMKNNFPAAIAELEKAQTSGHDARATMLMSRVYAKSGNRNKALKMLERLEKMSQKNYTSAYFFALAYAGLQENDKAFEWLEKGFQDREGRMTQLKVDPLLDEIRSDPRFDKLVQRIGL